MKSGCSIKEVICIFFNATTVFYLQKTSKNNISFKNLYSIEKIDKESNLYLWFKE